MDFFSVSAYLVLDLSIKEIKGFSEYIQKIPSFIEKHSGRYIVRGEVPEIMEGDWKPERLVIIEFPSRQHAKDFLAEPEAKSLFAIRHKTTDSKLLLVDGCL